MTKKELRTILKLRNLSLTADARAEASVRIFTAVEQLPVFSDARTVAVFCSLGDEPETSRALSRWRAGKRIVVPRVEGDAMQFYDYDPSQMCPGAFGIAEPASSACACDASQIDLIIVPGVAFTASGARLGRGKGFYDKYLALPGMRASKIGVCFAHQLAAELPAEPHDVVMDRVVTG